MHWVAHIFNRSDEVASAVPYAWTIDDEVVLRGVVDLLPGFEPLMQQHIRSWNDMLAAAVYPSTPEGALTRIRLDDIVVAAENYSIQSRDWAQADLNWVFTTNPRDERFLHKGASVVVLQDQTIVLHELLLQRGLIDLYDYAVRDDFGHGPEGFVKRA